MLPTHLIRAHGLTADQYRLAHGIAPHQPLESASTSVKKTANGHRVYEQRPDIRAALGGGTVPPTLARGPAVSRCTRQCGAAGPVRRYTSGALARRPHRCLQRLEEIGGPDHACRPVGLPAVPRYAPWSSSRGPSANGHRDECGANGGGRVWHAVRPSIQAAQGAGRRIGHRSTPVRAACGARTTRRWRHCPGRAQTRASASQSGTPVIAVERARSVVNRTVGSMAASVSRGQDATTTP
ncbi:hypothetical protein JK364_51615 [Streptomyces sp. 110]|uniref:Uncharacterized protein n=2 Tax=Streptomyces endocoffeicus TaxID=2898945 RepID=A0ABS1Q9M2_9ACTN|nr:hypothetical protein [Streptomyces endocoffeicus]